jgi:PHD/YefM family antitoxin component YafN of YafNO toxin-antitoxin module
VHVCNVVGMTETTCSIVEARARPGAIAREVGATREPVAITDHGRTIAIPVGPSDALELQEMRALAAFRARRAAGEDAGVR